MCGITGYVTGRDRPEWHHELGASVRSLTHRGPDDEGVWTSNGVGLGHRRLSIIDLSAGGHQPMASRGGRYVAVFNGEIYNFAKIRADLERSGERFVSHSDTEVILAAVEAWGIPRAIERFIGMFAIALWDRAERRLFLMRDRLGVKPLYYTCTGDHTLCFASELKALREYRHWSADLDVAAVGDFFQYGYIGAPHTIYRGVKKLPPGHWLEFTPGREPHVHRYWTAVTEGGQTFVGSENDAADQLEELMLDAFGLRMVADVPVGVFLSGGIDSSLVTAMLRKRFSNVRSFTIGFRETAFDESGHARSVAEFLGTRHTERVISIDEAREVIPLWPRLYDEPFADASGIPTYLVSKLASEQVKVALSADGGDELFSGYELHTSALRLEAKRARLGPFARRALALLPLDAVDDRIGAPWLPATLRGRLGGQFTRRAARMREYLGAPSFGDLYERLFTVWRPDELLSGDALGAGRDRADRYPGGPVEQMCLWDLNNYLPGDILTKVDRASMANGLEARDPLIDHRLVEFAFRLPRAMRRGSLGPKHLLKRILYKYIPRDLVERPKRGFAVPLRKWLRGELSPLIDRYLDPGEIRRQGLLDVGAVSHAVHKFRSGTSNDIRSTNRVWYLLAFQMWREHWL